MRTSSFFEKFRSLSLRIGQKTDRTKARVVALLAVRNEALYMERCLEHLFMQGIETCLIDNESSDATLEIARKFLDRGVFRIVTKPYQGYFDWVGLLQLKENIRRAGEVARLFFDNGNIVLCTFISPFKQDRDFVRSLFPEGRFVEIHVRCDMEECRKRDPNGLYEKAHSGLIKDFTGLTSPYEAPEQPELIIDTEKNTVQKCVDVLGKYLIDKNIINR